MHQRSAGAQRPASPQMMIALCAGLLAGDLTPTYDSNRPVARRWAEAPFSYNINGMTERETINGVPVTEEQIAAWADEAEAGYDVEALKKRGRGRPGRGAEPSQVIALRLTTDEIAALDARAEREGKTRSEVIREALAAA